MSEVPGEVVEDEGEQLALLTPRAAGRPRAGRPARPPRRLAGDDPVSEHLPVALVQVDTGLAHLDRPFEYLVTESMDATALPGVRVKVRFAGQDLDGFVLERRASAEHTGRLAPVRRVVSPEAVLAPRVLDVARSVAQRYAGTLGDVLRLAVPPRHAAAEKALAPDPSERAALPGPGEAAASTWKAYPAGPAFLAHVAEGGGPGRRSWRCPDRSAPTGPSSSPRPPGRRSRRGAASSSSSPTTATSSASRPRSSPPSARTG